jgi:hypothetical protein
MLLDLLEEEAMRLAMEASSIIIIACVISFLPRVAINDVPTAFLGASRAATVIPQLF